MQENILQIKKGEFSLNGVPVQKVTAFKAETLYSDNQTVSVSVTFEVPVKNLSISNIGNGTPEPQT